MSVYKIAENGESHYYIVAHQYADETIRYAASELQKYLLQSTNAIVPYFSDRCPSVSAEIRIGDFVRGDEWKNPTLIGLSEEAFSICGRDKNIYITGNSSRGVLYGVYYFLETFCGFTCFSKDVETIDKLSKLEIDLDEIIKEPAFEFRDSYFRFSFDGDFCAKNRLNSNMGNMSIAQGGRMKWFNFHHSFDDLLPPAVYFEEHPEYFSEIDGSRIQNSQLCLTNPEVARIAEKTLRGWIRENPECRVFSIAQNDNTKRCTCKSCLALEEKEGSPAGPIIHFVNRLADAIKEDYPRVLLHTFAYQYSLPAPKHVMARENVIVRLCSISCRFDRPLKELALAGSTEESEFVKALYDWKEHASRLYVWDYAVNFQNYLQPFIHLHTLQENIKFFKECGVKGVLEQGNFAYGGGAACDDLKSYVIAKLLWDPEADVNKEIGRFCRAVYGEAAGKNMEEYVSLMMKACERAPLSIYQHPNAAYLTDDLICEAEKRFEQALLAAENEKYKRRIEREFLSVRFLRLSRLPIDSPHRKQDIEKFFEDLKSFGIIEIRERRSLSSTKNDMLSSQYVMSKSGCVLYYIMK